VHERETTIEDEEPEQILLPFVEMLATPDPIAPERDMPMNYDPFNMASVLVKDITLAKTVSADVVQRLAAELLKFKPKEE
jgi:hypothetical protein